MKHYGYSAKDIQTLKVVNTAPGYLQHETHLLFAKTLTYAPKQGDEPEKMPVFQWKINELDNLMQQSNFTDARNIAAIMLAKSLLQK